ncbi:MAG: hypothetical protein II642_04005 [Firmicutes bacterium]|nr:hypothetical protein [Bacillota bacterium]
MERMVIVLGDDWDKGYNGIAMQLDDGAIHIAADEALRRFLKGNRRKACRRLVKIIHAKYEKKFGKRLKISMRSLDAEIRIHEYAGRVFNFWATLFEKIPLKPFQNLAHFFDVLRFHAEIVDCGELDQDWNRIFFDIFSVLGL